MVNRRRQPREATTSRDLPTRLITVSVPSRHDGKPRLQVRQDHYLRPRRPICAVQAYVHMRRQGFKRPSTNK
jgi:hypothetical protein